MGDDRCTNMKLQRIPGTSPWEMECTTCGRQWAYGQAPGPGCTHFAAGREVRTADRGVARKGDRVWNYYDLAWVTIAEEPDAEGWFSTTLDDGTRGPTLNGERITLTEIRPR